MTDEQIKNQNAPEDVALFSQNWPNRGSLPIILLLGLLLLGGLLGGFILFHRQPGTVSQVSSKPFPSSITAHSLPNPTSVLQSLDYPTNPVSYPSKWPPALHFPDQFVLVEATSGTLPSGNRQAWIAKLRYQGSPASAANILSSYFTTTGWQITRTSNENGSILLTVEKSNKTASGAVVIDPDTADSKTSKILTTIRL